MSPVLQGMVVALVGLVPTGALLTARVRAARRWRGALLAFRIQVPTDTTAKTVGQWLAAVSTWMQPGRFGFLPTTPIAMETVATKAGIACYIVIPHSYRAGLLVGLQALIPGARIEEAPDYLAELFRPRIAREWRLSTTSRQLNIAASEYANALILSGLQPLRGEEEIRVQWILTGARTPDPVSSYIPNDREWQFDDDRLIRESEKLKARRDKQRRPLLHAVGRLAIATDSTRRAKVLLGRVGPAFTTLNAPGVALIRRMLPTRLVARRARLRTWPYLSWPLLLNVDELAGLIGLPINGVPLPGLAQPSSRLLPTPTSMPTEGGIELGTTNYPGPSLPLTVQTSDRLRHTWLLGPTGVGKSTLIANMAVQDMEAGYGLILIEPRGDLIADILDRVPRERVDDVIVLDPGKTENPVGFNLLTLAKGEQATELISDHITHLLGEIFHSSWGPRTADVIRSSVLTLASARAADGSAFTLCELPELLTNTAFRRFVIRQKRVPDAVRSFWGWFDDLSEAERTQVIGPTMNKLRSFTVRTPLRLLLGQSRGIDLSEVFTQRKILLVNLSAGEIGDEAAALIGSLLVAAIWHTTLARTTIPREQRRPVWLYIDEFQQVVRLPLALADMFAQARALGLGVTVAHQYLDQLSSVLRKAILGTTRTHVAFQLGYDDAKTLAPRFAPLTPEDLTGLAAYEIAAKPCIRGATASSVTGMTHPLPEPTTDGPGLAGYSRANYGTPRQDVEDAIISRCTPPPAITQRIGEKPL